jgi:alanine racemase
MFRPTQFLIKPSALLHNLTQVRRFAPNKTIIAVIKANAYGCGVRIVAPTLEGQVDAFGVACIEEALLLRSLGIRSECVIFQGAFQPLEFQIAAEQGFSLILHHARQLQWLLNTPLTRPIKLWVKVNTCMNRLGFEIEELQEVMNALQGCHWVNPDIGLMTHLACADEPERMENLKQIDLFKEIAIPGFTKRSMANSAALMALPQTHADVLRPGIMLYGVSPFGNKTSMDLGLKPAMHFTSTITSIRSIPAFASVGYQGAWQSRKPSRIGIVAAGYGDGYPRQVAPNTPVWIKGHEVPIVGKISMDTLAVDLTNYPAIQLGDCVELWGDHILVERIAKAAGTIAYELLCQTSSRAK